MTHSIVACARGYVGTRFHHQGRLKKTATHKGGIDCLGLLVCVAAELDLRGKNGERLALLDETDYPHQPDTVRLRGLLSEHLQEIPVWGMCEGDIALFTIDGQPQHMGIISLPLMGEEMSIIHAYAPARAVVEHTLDGYWREKMTAVFRAS